MTPRLVAALVVALALGAHARAGEIGHFVAGVANIRDYVVPEPGFYGVAYDYFYTTDELHDRHGDEVDTITFRLNRLPQRPRVTLKLDVDVSVYALAPAVMWVE